MCFIPDRVSIDYVELAAFPVAVWVPEIEQELDGAAFAVAGSSDAFSYLQSVPSRTESQPCVHLCLPAFIGGRLSGHRVPVRVEPPFVASRLRS